MPWAMVVFWVPHKASAELMFDGGVPSLPVVIKRGQNALSVPTHGGHCVHSSKPEILLLEEILG